MAQAGIDLDDGRHPFVTALPPETDYMSYLTIVEANLNKASLPLLSRLLQDERLTTNVGWDLVHLLTPLLPESGQCLQTIARLGNPREVVVKVTEMLEIIGYDSAAADESDASSDNEQAGEHADARTKVSEKAEDEERRLRVLQFCHLLRMIGILHRRIKTKRPSRFLVTIAEAVSHAYRHVSSAAILQATAGKATNSGIDTHNDPTHAVDEESSRTLQGVSATDAVLTLLADLSAVIRPPLPPRIGSASSVLSQDSSLVPDPEAESGAFDSGEGNTQRRILVSLATHIAETLNARMREVLPMAEVSWTHQYMCASLPEKMVRHGRPPTDPGVDAMARNAQGALKRLEATLRSKFGVKASGLLDVVQGTGQDGLDLDSLEEFPASEVGVLCLLAEAISVGQSVGDFSAADHRHVVQRYLGDSSSIDFDPESLATIDAVLYLGWKSTETPVVAIDHDASKQTQRSYNEYLQQLSVVSANAPFSDLRYQAHLLVTKIIQETTDAGLRYGFIQDTLDFCPYANLKVTAVGWLKDQILAAAETQSGDEEENSMSKYFGQPATLDNVAISLFDAAEVGDEVGAVAAVLPFWLAALNLLYVICYNEKLRDRLEVTAMVEKYDLMQRFVKPLEGLARRLTDEEQGHGKAPADMWSDAGLLADAVSRAKDGLDRLSS